MKKFFLTMLLGLGLLGCASSGSEEAAILAGEVYDRIAAEPEQTRRDLALRLLAVVREYPGPVVFCFSQVGGLPCVTTSVDGLLAMGATP